MQKSFHFHHFSPYPRVIHHISRKSVNLPYECSLAFHTGEEREAITKNRQLVETLWEKEAPLYYVLAHQTHSDHIHCVTQKQSQGWQNQDSAIADCDALISNIEGLVLGILTADCVPILLHDPIQNVVAGVHAGWKGTAKEILLKTVKKMQERYHSNPHDIIAGIAPSIGKCCYEVGFDVAKHFVNIPKSYEKQGDKYMLDLPYINSLQLLQAGLQEKNIERSPLCTACHNQDYFSYRKEQGCSGRFISMIGLKNTPSKKGKPCK